MNSNINRVTTRVGDDVVTKEAHRALLASFVGYAMDGFDLLVLAFMLGAIAADFHLAQEQVVFLVTATLVGAVIGGFLFGALSDHIGRVRMLTWSILVFAGATGLCALAQGFWEIFFARTIAGMGLGGEFGIGMALVAETWPASKRARVTSYVAMGSMVGFLGAALITPMLLPVIGWRGMFALGALPALGAYLIRRSLQEPKLFVARHAVRQSESLRILVKDAATVKITVSLAFMCSVLNFGYYGVIIWLPNYLSTQLGLGLTKSVIWTAVTILGGFTGMFVFGHLADRLGRRPTFFFFLAGAAVMVNVYAHLTEPMALLAGGAVLGFFISGTAGGYGALMSELYPTAARATAENVLFNIGRAFGGFGPVVVGAIVVTYGFSMAIALLSILYLLDLVVLWAAIPERRAAELE